MPGGFRLQTTLVESAGRLLQMVLEIETYRTLAVMGMDGIGPLTRLYKVANELPNGDSGDSTTPI